MGPKHDTSNDMTKTNTMTDNELLPGLDIAHYADPKVKGWLSAEIPTETSEPMALSSTQGKGSAEPDGGKQILITDKCESNLTLCFFDVPALAPHAESSPE